MVRESIATYRKNEDNRRRCDSRVAEFMGLREGPGKKAQKCRNRNPTYHVTFKPSYAWK